MSHASVFEKKRNGLASAGPKRPARMQASPLKTVVLGPLGPSLVRPLILTTVLGGDEKCEPCLESVSRGETRREGAVGVDVGSMKRSLSATCVVSGIWG